MCLLVRDPVPAKPLELERHPCTARSEAGLVPQDHELGYLPRVLQALLLQVGVLVHGHGVAHGADVVNSALDDLVVAVAQAIHLLHVEGPDEARRPVLVQLGGDEVHFPGAGEDLRVEREPLREAGLDGGVDCVEGSLAAMGLEGVLVALEESRDDVRRHDVLDVLRKVLQAEAVVKILHLADRRGDLRLAEHAVEERVVEDAAQQGAVAEAGAEAVPRGATCLGDHERALSGGLGGLLVLRRRGRLGVNVHALGLHLGLRLLRLLGFLGLLRLPAGAGLRPPLGLLRLLGFVREHVEERVGLVHHALKRLPRLREDDAGAGRPGLLGGLQPLGSLLQRLVLLLRLAERGGRGGLDVLRLLLPGAQQLRGPGGGALELVAPLRHLLLEPPLALVEPLGGVLGFVPVLLQLGVLLHVPLHLFHDLLDEASALLLGQGARSPRHGQRRCVRGAPRRAAAARQVVDCARLHGFQRARPRPVRQQNSCAQACLALA
mmetsp:Transcript_49624/g.131193  ORF Transcript_49624/g.131193 Transcript_49624/m.131193 type:complete len:492 (+) Transcript_49624:12-1487(+)